MRKLFSPAFLVLMLVGCSSSQTSTDPFPSSSPAVLQTPSPAVPQAESDVNVYPHTDIEEKPALLDGLRGLANRIRYPAIARKAGVNRFMSNPQLTTPEAIPCL